MDCKDKVSKGQAGTASPSRAPGIGLKITSAQRAYYRYTGVSAEVQRHGLRSVPRQDFTRLPRAGKREE